MKKQLILALLASLSLNSLSFAQEMNIPVVSSPSALQEGTQRELTAEQIAELLPWAKDSKIFLNDLLDQVHTLPMDQKIERLIDGIKQVVLESAPKHSELIMRYALNRALVVNDILSQEMQDGVVGTADAKFRVLNLSINLAIKYHDSDLANLTNRTTLPYAAFGLEYFNFLHELNKSIFDASAQYNIERTALEFLQWDLYRDINNTSYAPQILKINNALKIFPVKKMSDANSINYIRQMKKVVQQLSLGDKIQKVESSNENSVIFNKKEEERREQETVKSKNTKLYDGKCYATDSSGSILWDAGKLSWRQCHNGKYKTYDGKCYATDKNSSIIWDAGKVDWNFCHSKQYKTYDGNCYATDVNGSIIWDAGQVIWNSCHSGSYKTYDGKCYATDSNGSILWGAGKMDPYTCHSGRYKTYDGACYPTDVNGSILWDAGKAHYTKCQ